MMRFRLIAGLFLLPSLVFGQSEEFTIRVLVGTDTMPPGTPSITAVVPMSPYQIDIAWGAVSDDVYVEGYRLYRDGVLLATTTLTSYVDMGLTPSTTYAYTVDAFDYSFNFSTTSVPVATTTLLLPPPVATTSSSSVATPSPATATAVPTLRTFAIDPEANGAVITFASYGPTRYVLRYGQTAEYELGTVSSNLYATNHASRLTSLEPGTRYYVELTMVNSFGVARVVATVSFVTDPALVSLLPMSVTGVAGAVRGNDAVLSWQNPAAPWRAIRVVRSHLFYPQNATDGVVVYEGSATSYVDAGVFSQRDSYYYSIFVMAEDGRVSAPAVLWLQAPVPTPAGLPGTTQSSPAPGEFATTTPPATLPAPVGDSGLSQYLMPSDVFITVGDRTMTLDSLAPLPVGTDVLVSIPYGAVPRHLKTILLSVYHPADHSRVTTYLLKLRGDGATYEVNFMSSAIEGEGKLVVEVFDYEHESVRRLSRVVQYVATREQIITPGEVLGTIQRLSWVTWFVGIGGLVISWWLLLLWRRRREDNQ